MFIFNRFPQGKTKCLTLSYDDGTIHDRRFIETINRYGLRATFHLNGGKIGTGNSVITADEVPTLYQGHEVSLHSFTHPTLSQQPPIAATMEIVRDREALEEMAGQIVRGMSYPNGAYNDMVLEVLRSCGVDYCRTVVSTGKFDWPENFLTWHPTCHHDTETPNKVREFLGSRYRGLLCYIWGHSYEFNTNNNWELLEDICKAATTDVSDEWYHKVDNVWFATNIEIFDYITAVRGLKVSQNGKMLYNPSATDVWVEIRQTSEAVCIPAGATIKL